jgi:hypothetical protein
VAEHKFELCLRAGPNIMETRTRSFPATAKGRNAAIDWAAQVGIDSWRDGMTSAVLAEYASILFANPAKVIWDWEVFVLAVGKLCTCSQGLKRMGLGLHSGDCPALNWPAHKIWRKR